MNRATLTTPWGQSVVVLLSDKVDELEMGSTPSFIAEESNHLITTGRVKRILADESSASFWTSEGEWKLEALS